MKRILAATFALGILGAATSAVAVSIVLGIFAAISHPSEVPTTWIMAAGAVIGAIGGAVIAPLASWSLLRSVPIWRASVETSFAAAAAFALTVITTDGLLFATIAAFAAALLAALRLRFAFRQSASGSGAAATGT